MDIRPKHALIGLLLAATAFAPARAGEASWPDLSRPAPAVKPAGKDIAIIAAIERYAFVSPIAGASDNADGWYDYFTKTLGMPPEKVLLLKDNDVTREELLASLQKSASDAPKGGALWFVFIGHGAPGPKGEEGFLVGVDAQQKASSLYARSVSETEMRQALNKAPSARINVILDACFSGRDPSGNALVGGLQPLLLHGAPAAADPRWVVLTAAHADQFAGPLPGAGRPAFSYLALGALRGWAGPGKAVTAGGVLDYTKRAMSLLVKGRQQSPTLQGDPAAAMAPLSRETGPDLAALQKSLSGGEAAELDRKACDTGDGRACLELAYASKDQAKAVELFRRSCDLGDGAGCGNLGVKYAGGEGVGKDHAQAVGLFRKACEMGDGVGCGNLGYAYSTGEGLKQDQAKAVEFFLKSCGMGDGTSCRNLGNAYDAGEGVAQDKAKAAEYYQMSCRLGVTEACLE